jgi:hypothetical protein
MAVSHRFRGALAALAMSSFFLGGCQGMKAVEHKRLIEHQALIDFSGLKAPETLEDVRARAGLPESWKAQTPQKTGLYTHGQWKSASGHTAVGAVLIRLPLPLSADMVAWFAKREYTKRAEDGKLIREWKDAMGRRWFEAENSKYHVRGYCIVQGFQAWVVYFGYKTQHPPNFDEISLAARSADTFLPLTGKVESDDDARTAGDATKRNKAPATQPAPVAAR